MAALDPNTKPTTPGKFNGEIRNGWSWVSASNMWLDFSGINIGNTNVVDNLRNAGVTNLALPGGLGGPGGRGVLPDYTIDLDRIRKGIEDNPDAFNINVNAGFGNGPEFRNLNTNQLNTLLTDVQAENVVRTIPPINYRFTLNFKSDPSSKKGYRFTDTNQPISSGAQFKAEDFREPRTIGAIDSGKANEVYRAAATVGSDGQYQVIFVNTSTGLEYARTLLGKPQATLSFSWPKVISDPPPPPSNDTTVTLQHELPSGITAVVNLNGKTTTIAQVGQSTITNEGTTLSITPTSNSSYNHIYTLYEDASGRVLSKSGDIRFSYSKLEAGKNYKLKISVSKGEIPQDPPADPAPANSPSYRYDKYTISEKRTSGESAPGYTKPTLTLTDGDLVTFNIGEGGDGSIEIPFTTNNADWVNVKTTGKFRKNTYNNKLVLTSDDFNAPGLYLVWLQPDSNINGTGEAKSIAVTVISKDFLPGPDITRIDFPETIIGEDYKGYNIDFGVNWESINTNYIDIYVGKVSQENRILKGGPAMGSQQFNIGKILKQAGESLNETQDWVYFDLYLIPYNEEGDSLTKGKVESIQIAFDKGNILLRRPDVHRDISDAICNQFDSSALAQDNSKYLTHLMHFGDGDNKLIATWCTDYETFSEYEDVVQSVGNDEGEYVDQIVRKKTKEEETLVFKMYEPLPRNIQPNQQIWVSKIQSIPIIEQVTLINEELKECIELKPNFGEGICDPLGYQLYDDLVTSGSSTTTSLLSQFVSGSGFDLKNLDIQYVSSSKVISGSVIIDDESSWYWSNFVKYSSAEERINNFMYKIKLLEFYDTKIEQLKSGSFYTGSVRMKKEIEDNELSKQTLTDNFDGFEYFLFTSSSVDGLTYPGASGNELSSSNSDDAITWYSSAISSAQEYDYYNKDYLVNNLPQHIIDNQESEEFKMFFNMIGHHFDVLHSYTKSLAQKKNLEHKYQSGIKDALLSQMLKSLGWDAKMGASAQALWTYAFGQDIDGTQTTSMSGKDRQNEVWRRLLNNLPYLMKHKGTSRAVKAALSCYGVPSSMLTIMEFGGPRNGDGGVTKFSFEDRTAAINISGSQSILVPWKEYSETNEHPQSVEIRVNSEVKQDQTFISSSGWNVGVEYGIGNLGRVKFEYLSGSTLVSQSTEYMPFFNDEYTQIVVQHVATGSFEVYAKEAFNERIRNAVSMSISNVPTSSWELDTNLTIGGSTMSGSVDEFRYWTSALTESRIDNHTLLPDAIDGNHTSSSTEDLVLRLDFEYPKDRNVDPYIKNVSINEGYVVPFVTASNFDSIAEYPYHYTTYERTVTANVPSSGFNVGNKFRFESQQAINQSEDIETGLTLSYRERSTKKSFDTSPIDSNRLGLFFSPIKEVNMDILKSLGQFELDSYIGDPSDSYKSEYKDLRVLRNYYFERFSLNIYEYIQLVRYIDQSLFETLETLVPARAIVSSGLLIEPHLLERNKVQHRKPQAVDVGGKLSDGKITLREGKQLLFEEVEPLNLKLEPNSGLNLDVNGKQIKDGRLKSYNPRFRTERQNYNGFIRSVGPAFISSTDLIDGRVTDTQFIQQLLRQELAFGGQSQVGVDPRNLKNGLAGIYARNGIANITRLDGNGQLIKERKQVWIVTEQYTEIEKQVIPGTGQRRTINDKPSFSGSMRGESIGDWTWNGIEWIKSGPWIKEPLYRDVTVTKTRKVVVFNNIGDPQPSGDNILSVEPANPNGGRLPGGNLGDKYGKRGFRSPSRQTNKTTLDGRSPVETFCTNPNILKVSDTARGKGEPILEVDKK